MRAFLIVGCLAVASSAILGVRSSHAQASAAFCSYYPYHPDCRTSQGYIDPYTGRQLPPPRGNVPWDPYGDGSGRTGGYQGGGGYRQGECAIDRYTGRCAH